jgi:hypothetical protein
MYVRKRIGRKRSFYKKHRVLLHTLAFLCVCVFAFIYASGVRVPLKSSQNKTPSPVQIPEPDETYELATYERAVYPYSVIPGGVRSREELAAKMSEDKVVLEHFSDFQVSRARIVKAEETQFAYVSYRMDDQVYWTSKKLKIPEGETLITDGENCARTRCGNMVSPVPMEPVAEEEPMVETFDVPSIAPVEIRELGPIAQVDLELREFSPFETLEPKILPYYFRPLFVIQPEGPYIPEPGTLVLLISGLGALLYLKLVKRK